MVKFRSCGLALSCLAMLAAAASGQQYRQGNRTGQVQPQQRQPAQTQYGQQPQYRQQTQYRQQPQYRQQTEQRTYSATSDESGRTRGGSGADQKIATLLANSNKAKIKLARYALNRAESSEVRTFADALQQDHDLMLRQLRRFAPEVADADSSSRGYGEGEQRRSSDARPARAWNETTVAQQISDRLVRKARDELSEREGWEFDHTFVAQQLVGHQQMIAKMEVYRQYASPELRHVIDEGIQIAEGHEQEARDLVQDMQRGHGREEYAESRSDDESDWDDEGRVERASYEERRRESRDDYRSDDNDSDDYRSDEDRSYRDDAEDDDRSGRGSARTRRDRDDDEDDDDDRRRDRDDRSDDDSRD